MQLHPAPGLSRYICSSMANATESSGGKYTKLFHMDSKVQAAIYAKSLLAVLRSEATLKSGHKRLSKWSLTSSISIEHYYSVSVPKYY